jgi:phage terminase large subunit GpA-like protein
VFTAKEAIMARLAKIRDPGPGYIHIPDWIDSELLAQLTAEKLITKIVGGIPKRVWIKTRDRNEFLDLFVYALGMLHALGLPTVRGLGARARAMIDAATERAEKEELESPAKDPEPPSRPKTRPRRGWMRDF